MIGIVVCGGKSSRMGADKSTLDYHGKPQHDYIYDMLVPFCEAVLISCNAEQMSRLQTSCPLLPDLPEYADSGPVSALLTAFQQFPDKDILLIGCDYPLLTSADLDFFIKSLAKEPSATAFYNSENRYEPLLAFYQAILAVPLQNSWNAGNRSLQIFLRENGAARHFPASKRAMFSADTPEDSELVRILLNKNLS